MEPGPFGRAIERVANGVLTPDGPGGLDAMDARLEILKTVASDGHELSAAAADEMAALRSSRAAAARERQRERRRAWAQHATAAPAPQGDRGVAHPPLTQDAYAMYEALTDPRHEALMVQLFGV